MDISKFNQALAKKIKAATILEKHKELSPAIEAWVEVSQMTLNASKSTALEASFRSMLIKKTEDIIEHIKQLKLRNSGNLDFIEKTESPMIEPKNVEKDEENNLNTQEESFEIEKPREIKSKEGSKEDDKKQIPNGLKEIKANKDFKIITPHDEEQVQKRLNTDIDFTAFKKQGIQQDTASSPMDNNPSIELNKQDPEGKNVCFACGSTENPPNAKKCLNCGADLD